MRNEFDKKKTKKKTGQDEFGVILLDEDPQWVWMREDAAQNNIVLRLDQQYGYTINVTQGDTEIIDYELGDGPIKSNKNISKSIMYKFLKRFTIALFIWLVFFSIVDKLRANEIYVAQSGSNVDLDITQDGENNQVEGLSGSGYAIVYGNNTTTTFTQTGDNNQIRVWSDSSSGKKTDVSQTGNNNISLADNHGQDNTIITNVTGNSNYTFDEIGNGGDTDNTITTTINGDSNNTIAEVQNGDNNTIDVQVQSQDSNIVRVYVNGDNNNAKVWQGKHESGSVDRQRDW